MIEIGNTGAGIDDEAWTTGYRVTRQALAGRPAVLVFHGRDNQDEGRGVVQSIRNDYRTADEVFVANVVDVSMFPRVMRKLVKHDLDVAYRRETDVLPGDLDAERHIVIVPDHSGQLCRAWGAPDPARTVSGVLLDADWQVRRTHVGAGLDQAMLAGLAALTAR